MELMTRCPECETVFAVTLDQLRLRKGYIRCIQCANIFDGFEAVVPAGPLRQAAEGGPPRAGIEPQLCRSSVLSGNATAAGDGEAPGDDPFTISGTVPLPASREPRVPSVLRGRDDIRASAASDAGPAFTISDSPGPAHDSEPGFGRFAPRDQAPASPPRIHAGTPPKTADDPVTGEPSSGGDYIFVEPRERPGRDLRHPEFYGDVRPRPVWLTFLWVLLILCAIALLLVQGVYVYRAQLANAFPVLRPQLEAACARISCTVPYERRIDAIAITGSALRATAPPTDDVSNLTLEVTLRNTNPRPQEWPTLVLDLKDASGTVVVRRNLVPSAWVPAELRNGPFEAGMEITVHVPVSVRGLQANGYQLDKFYP